MRRLIFVSVFVSAIMLAQCAVADDSATDFALKPPPNAKDLNFHRVHPFFPLRPGNVAMSPHPAVHMSPPAQPISMSKQAPLMAPAAKTPAKSYPQMAAEPGFQPVLSDKPDGVSTMSREQAQQILSLFPSSE